MKKFGIGVMVLAAILVIAMVMSTLPSTAASGNGAPSGAHYNLNIIGVSKDKTVDMTSGGRIFVPLCGQSYIWLKCGDSFKVLDANGCDKTGATLQLPDPYTGIYTTTSTPNYKIYVRALGKPGGSATMTSGFVDEYGNCWYSLDSVEVCRKAGQSIFKDRTLELTTIQYDFDGDGDLERVGLFDNAAYNYFWQYDNDGLKVLQMRFYMCT